MVEETWRIFMACVPSEQLSGLLVHKITLARLMAKVGEGNEKGNGFVLGRVKQVEPHL